MDRGQSFLEDSHPHPYDLNEVWKMIEEHVEEKTMVDIVKNASECVKGTRWICRSIPRIPLGRRDQAQ